MTVGFLPHRQRGHLQQETNLLILGDNIPLRTSYQSSVILFSDKHNYIYLVYSVFVRYYYSQYY